MLTVQRSCQQSLENKNYGWKKDQDARADILLAIDAKILNLVKAMKISKEIWDFLEETYNRKSARQKVKVYRKVLNFKINRNHTIVS